MNPFSLIRLFYSYFSKLRVFAIWVGIISFPVFSATLNLDTLIDYNFIFILGLSCPLIIIAALLKEKISVRWQLLLLSTFTLLFLLCSLGDFFSQRVTITLVTATFFLILMSLWPFYNHGDINVKYKKTTTLSVVISGIIYSASLWLFPQINRGITWLLFNSFVLFIVLFFMFKQYRHSQPQNKQMFIQWILASAFTSSIFLWINNQLNNNYLIIICVLIYFVSILISSRQLVQQINNHFSSLDKNRETKETHYNDEYFSYTHDPITHLPSYQFALKQFKALIMQNDAPNYAVLIFQPINFTQVNTLLGHHNSDILLLQLAYCLQQNVAKNTAFLNFETHGKISKLARLQGLRFLSIIDLSLNHHPDQIVIDDFCKQIALSVPSALSFKSLSLNFELAFGVNIIKNKNRNVSKIITQAEDALLMAQEKLQLIQYFDDSRLLNTEQQLVKMEQLKLSIINNQLEWFIQPQISLSNKEIRGFNLSVCWLTNSLKQSEKINLADFIHTAELSGDIYLLAHKMIIEAFKLLENIQRLEYFQKVTINLSSASLLEPDIIDFIENTSKKYNISTKYLIVELNENILFSKNNHHQIFIDQLRSLNIGIAIDDFSGSYYSLKFLRKMVVNQIKINCLPLTKTADMLTEKAIINALINLASTMNIPLIGTEINNQKIANTFAQIGGELAQGAEFSASILPKNIGAWLINWQQQHSIS